MENKQQHWLHFWRPVAAPGQNELCTKAQAKKVTLDQLQTWILMTAPTHVSNRRHDKQLSGTDSY